ncbi:MAG: hypothetical protein U1F43_15020 [Myxococcota bacterium]
MNSVALSDVDQDGRLDAVVSLDDAYSASIEVLYQDRASATPSFVADHSFVASSHETNFSIPADMDPQRPPGLRHHRAQQPVCEDLARVEHGLRLRARTAALARPRPGPASRRRARSPSTG